MPTEPTLLRAIDTVRLLAADGVQAANSGHPGMPMGCADYAFTLWSKYLRHNPGQAEWLGRDRFVLSAGHGSMLLYSLLHLFEYGLALDDLANFRQWDSKTPGHPEFGHTAGVEVTTGPLASGLASGVGMAIGMKQLGANMDNSELFNQRVFVVSGDGCMMEGTSHEACALAGHLKLDNIVLFYDDNGITIEGGTEIAFSEDVGKRFDAYGWHVIRIDGQDVAQIEAALTEATNGTGKPVIIIGKTTIGKGSPNKGGLEECHGAPLGTDELALTKKALGFDPDKSFVVEDEVRALCETRCAELRAAAAAWDAKLAALQSTCPEKADLLTQLTGCVVPENLLEELMAAVPEKDTATRNSGGVIMQKVAELVPALTGGSADLNPSTKTYLKGLGEFGPDCLAGRNVHFGVRELGMGMAANGMALSGVAIPFSSTFAVFSDYMKPAMRLAALQGLKEVFVFTHDSIFVGEDGPTHQPIEQVLMCRSIPGMTVIRPAESNEVAQAWAAAMNTDGPTALFLTRQTVPNFDAATVAEMDLAKGAYILSDDADFEVSLIATGSEVGAAVEAAELLRAKGRKVRVVSMPSWELFEAQDAEYQATVMPEGCYKRVSIEAGTTIGWDRYTGRCGLRIGIDHFGASAPYTKLAEEWGFTGEGVAKKVDAYLG
ncbi:MAG: transketolase [Victivallales bacterium]|nr:transketolase [Victivallales bacterium]